MSDQTPENTAETETSETPVGSEPAVSRPVNPLSRPTDAIARPGFRNPPNKKTKAQKGRRRKKK